MNRLEGRGKGIVLRVLDERAAAKLAGVGEPGCPGKNEGRMPFDEGARSRVGTGQIDARKTSAFLVLPE